MMARVFSLFLALFFSQYFFFGIPQSHAASLSFDGQLRAQHGIYNKLSLQGNQSNKTYNVFRALLQPNVVIDDHFKVRSQWALLASPGAGGATPGMQTPPATTPLGSGQGGYILGDRATVGLFLSRAWLEWTSDFGVFRLGRMPVAWGYGLLYDEGSKLWDNWQTTFDRIEYRLHLGYVMGGLAISEPRRSSLLSGGNDSTFYAAYLQYQNPEVEVEAGILYEKQARSSSQNDELLNKNFATGGQSDQSLEMGLPPGTALTPYTIDNHILDVYFKKTIRYFSFGGELSWLSGKAADYDNSGSPDSLSALATMVNLGYKYHSVNAFLEFLYASGDSSLGNGELKGFVLLHRNRHPGLILGRELLGAPAAGNHTGLGSTFAYGAAGSFSGVLFFRPGLRMDWSKDWSTGLEMIIARKASTAVGEAANLGVEIDLGTEYAVYKNAVAALDLGFLIPGDGLGVTGAHGPFAVRASLGVSF